MIPDKIIERLKLVPTDYSMGNSKLNDVVIYRSDRYGIYLMKCNFRGEPINEFTVFRNKFERVTRDFLENCEEYIVSAILTKL